MSKLIYKVLDTGGEQVAAFRHCRDAIDYSRQIIGRVKYGTWIVWNWQKDTPLPGTSLLTIRSEISKRIREKHIAALRRQGVDDGEIERIMGGPV